jgi:hypothetical protein
LEVTLLGVRAALRTRSSSRALQSIADQLEYLLAFVTGENVGSAIATINVGVLAARDVEEADLSLATALYRIQATIDRPREERRNA